MIKSDNTVVCAETVGHLDGISGHCSLAVSSDIDNNLWCVWGNYIDQDSYDKFIKTAHELKYEYIAYGSKEYQ